MAVRHQRCTGCGRRLPYTSDFFHRKGRYLEVRCRDCRNADARRRYRRDPEVKNNEERRRYHRARQRALTRIARVYPELYDQLFIDELRRDTG